MGVVNCPVMCSYSFVPKYALNAYKHWDYVNQLQMLVRYRMSGIFMFSNNPLDPELLTENLLRREV